MEKSVLDALILLLKEAANQTSGYSITLKAEAPHRLQNVSGWAAGPIHAAFQVVEKDSKSTLNLLLAPWRNRGEHYLILYSEGWKTPLVEIRKLTVENKTKTFSWTYTPRREDKNNPERSAIFRQYFLSTNVRISVPTFLEDVADFLDEMFVLMDVRNRAHELDTNSFGEREGFPEGRKVFRLHQQKERSRALVQLAKARALERTGKLECEACLFNFSEAYGSLGRGFIEAHHLIPVAELEADAVSKVEDLALLCSNCHRMVHRYRPCLTREELPSILINGKPLMKVT